MCGICVKVTTERNQADPELLERMSSVIAHRGPDGEGIYLNTDPQKAGPFAGLAHKRLSIIDLSENARQPISVEDETMRLTYKSLGHVSGN